MKLIPVVTDRNEIIYINPEKIVNVRTRTIKESSDYELDKTYHISLEDFGFDIKADEWNKLKNELVRE